MNKEELILKLEKITKQINAFILALKKQEAFMKKVTKITFSPIVLLLTLGMSLPFAVLINTITVTLVVIEHQMFSTKALEEKRTKLSRKLREDFDYYYSY